MSLEEAAAVQELVPVIAVTMGCLIAIILPVTYMVTSNWRKVRQHEQNAVLKKAMLDRGLSAGEIESVIAAGHGHEVWENEEAVKTLKRMIQKGYAAKEIAKVMHQGPTAANIKS
jgi:SOS response regulatory protein OraA/RecX